ncbi:very short patch repair endonuclease [Mesorhizobium sp. WSM1497]|uniref:very short patch repair endonuclease n=1 Tax=Mesorhizobium sp. WSM1497 TaxID=278153 RepID=UPI0007ECD5FE|nr:very short patch repair endonuclease [Mesorhizobium sp. WSM1497]ARP65528.1 very short patch repair endonuclease [Mesorhizobium sp. WSM1497]
MADIVSPEVRSRMMAGIKGVNTKPEMMLRLALHAGGFRYRLHDRRLPGRPDMVFPRRRAVLFAHGCFWHGHDCHLFRLPATRPEFWREKIAGNRQRDETSERALIENGWRCGVVWECALRGRTALPFADLIVRCAAWLESGQSRLTIRGVE